MAKKKGCSGDGGVGDVGWRWVTTVLTTSCELVPISCGVTVIFFGVRALIKSDKLIHFYQTSHRVVGCFHTQHLRLISGSKQTHINFAQDDIHHAADDDDEVKDVPGVSKVTLQEEVRTHC